ncbi:MAG: CocE/NonD family hydrolase [Candidatus Sericytochromatia bacterium]|nr:CocE/NonD family hydrolase [Candidatus Sericytochromatia bacterium]
MRSAALLLAGLTLADVVSWLPADLTLALVQGPLGVRPPAHAITTEEVVDIPMRDSVKLAATVSHPAAPGPHPTLMVRLPLSQTRLHRAFSELLRTFWGTRGYHVVIAPVRGRPPSGGRFSPLEPEREDGLDTLAWLARQPWYDGHLGMWGGSSFGYTQWAVADQPAPIGPSACCIQLCSTSHREMFHPGGAFSLQSALYWARTDRGDADVFPSEAELAPGLAAWPVLDADDRSGGPAPPFDDWAGRRAPDAYWRRIDGDRRPERVQAPVLLMAGWHDPYLPTQLADFERLQLEAPGDVAAESRLIVGPWTHAREVTLPGGHQPGDYRLAMLAQSLPFYDRLLRPAGVPVPEPGPRVWLYVMGENRWRAEEAWPLARARRTPLYLHAERPANTADGAGRLAWEMPGDQPPDTFAYDPRDPVPSRGGAMLGLPGVNGVQRQNDVEQRRDVLVYTTEALPRPLEVTGPVEADMWVETTAPATDFTAKLVDVLPNGDAFNVSEGILRRSYAGQRGPTRITVQLWPTSYVFQPGHRLRLEVSSSSFPRFDRHPNTAEPVETATAVAIATQRVHHSARWLSALWLPVIPPTSEGESP